METTLETIKNAYAIEQGYEDWDQYFVRHFVASSTSRTAALTVFEMVMDEICIRAQKAALENAAENVTTVHHANQSSDEIERAVHYTKHSITNPENLIR